MQVNVGDLLPQKTAAQLHFQRDRSPSAGQSPKWGNLLPGQNERQPNAFSICLCAVEGDGGVAEGGLEEGVEYGRYRLPPLHQTILGKIVENNVIAEGNGRNILRNEQRRELVLGRNLCIHARSIATTVSKPVSKMAVISFQ